jgi:hypothetical protein
LLVWTRFLRYFGLAPSERADPLRAEHYAKNLKFQIPAYVVLAAIGGAVWVISGDDSFFAIPAGMVIFSVILRLLLGRQIRRRSLTRG